MKQIVFKLMVSVTFIINYFITFKYQNIYFRIKWIFYISAFFDNFIEILGPTFPSNNLYFIKLIGSYSSANALQVKFIRIQKF